MLYRHSSHQSRRTVLLIRICGARLEPPQAVEVEVGGERFNFYEGKTTGRMDFQVKSNGRIQAVAEDGTPYASVFMHQKCDEDNHQRNI